MSLLNKFRAQPEWQSDDPLVRVAAVRDLSKGDGSQGLLLDIARQDADPSVRLEAISWIDDLDALVSVVRSDDDVSVRTFAREILRQLVVEAEDEAVGARGLQELSADRDLVVVAESARLAPVSLAALARLDDQRAIGAVARRAAASEVAKEALARLEDFQELEAVAIKTADKAVAVMAFERLTEGEVGRDLLEQLSKRAKHKAVQRRARAALRALDAVKVTENVDADLDVDVETVSVTAHDHLGLCEELEAVRGEEDLDRGQETLDRLLQRWSELDVAPDEALGIRFREARTAAETRLADLDVVLAARRREEESERAALAATQQQVLEEHLQEMDQLLSEMERLVEADVAIGGSGEWSEVSGRWRGLLAAVGETDSEQLTTRLARHSAAEQTRNARESAVRSDREKAEQDNLQRLKHLVSTIKGLVSSEKLQLAEAERQMRSLGRVVDSPGPLPRRDRDTVVHELERVHRRLRGRVRELRDFADWQRWANLGIQDSLCRQMDGLRELSDDAELAERFREIMTRWRDAADVPKEKGAELWQRFKTAHDAVAPRAEKYREAQAAVREENLVHQKALVEEAERLSSSTDWLKTVQRVTELQAEWKAVGPGPRKQEKDLWNRFRTACNTFFTRRKADLARRKEVWASNLRLKEELCGRIEALAETEDTSAAIATAKQAQADWKTVGPVRRTRSEAVWKRFRTACDGVFDRAQAVQREAEAERAGVREALCVEVESLLPEETASEPVLELAEKVRDLQSRWRAAPDVPPPLGRTLTTRFGQAVARLVEKSPDAFRGTDLDPVRRLKRLEKLCERIDALGPAEAGGSQPASPAELLASKWRDALASNLMGARVDEAAERRSAASEVRRAQQDLRRLGNVTGDEGQQLIKRFHATSARVLRWAEPKKPTPKPTPRSRPQPTPVEDSPSVA